MEPDKPAEIVADSARTLRIDVRVCPEEEKALPEKSKAAGY
ncbi:hypothetical protein [Hymenobacter terricola]|nr:hypothetical protein [Hymenobacter terricola]